MGYQDYVEPAEIGLRPLQHGGMGGKIIRIYRLPENLGATPYPQIVDQALEPVRRSRRQEQMVATLGI